MELDVQIDLSEFRQEMEREKRTLLKRTELFAKLVAEGIVNHARSKKGGTVPGAGINAAGTYQPKGSRGSRQAHPGGWADITGHLAESIQQRVEQHGFSIKIVVEATMEYAAALDAKTGYDVLGGAEELARKYINQHKHILFK